MLIPSRDAKSYGAIHVDNYLSFIGFCKKVDSADIQTVDVYLDNKKIDSIPANENIEKIEELYDIENHAFTYELPEEYIGKVHLLQFKCADEELVNSPIKTISKDNPKFNEYRFFHSLEIVNPDEIKDLYCPNSIGFLAVRENLNDITFINYIKELKSNFPKVKIKIFDFTEENIKLIEEKISNLYDEFYVISDIHELTSKIDIYIHNVNIDSINLNYRKLYVKLLHNFTNIFASPYSHYLKDETLIDNEKHYDKNHIFIKDYKLFNIDNLDKGFILSYYSDILHTIGEPPLDMNLSIKKFNHFYLIHCALKDERFKTYYHNMHLTYKKILYNE